MTETVKKPSIESLTKPGIQKIPPYIPGDTAESARKKSGVANIIKLASNENQLGTSPKAIEAVEGEIKRASIYPDPFCMDLRGKIGAYYGLTPHNVIITAGGSGAISLVGEVFLNAGDEVVFCAPTFTAYRSSAIRASAKAIALPLRGDGVFDLESMADAVTEKTKLVYVCNPNNPTGGTLKREELISFIESLPPHVITVLDEAYIEFATDPGYGSLTDYVNDEVRLIVMHTFSKAYGMAGLRIGYILTSQEIHASLMRAVTTFTGNRFALAAAAAAITDDDFLKRTVDYVRDGREYLKEEFTKLGFEVFPSQANFIYVDTKVDPADLAEKVKSRGLVIRGNFDYNRITIGTREQNEKMVDIIKEVLAEGVLPRK